jgi:hypothetical protein
MSLFDQIREDPKERTAFAFGIATIVPAAAGIAVAATLEVWWMLPVLCVLVFGTNLANSIRLWRLYRPGEGVAPPAARSVITGFLVIAVSAAVLVLSTRA